MQKLNGVGMRRDMVNQLKLLMMITALLFVTACEHEKDDLSAYVIKIKAKQKADIPPLPVMKPYEKFSYSAADLRNPFVPTVVEVAEEKEEIIVDNGIKPDQHRLKEALESYELSELQFVGTLEQENVWALIRSSDGVIHRVQKGNYIGKNHGEVLSILDTVLTLKEIVLEGDGRYIERDSSLSVVEIK
jgi:type IV pilus assembly protein PilP